MTPFRSDDVRYPLSKPFRRNSCVRINTSQPTSHVFRPFDGAVVASITSQFYPSKPPKTTPLRLSGPPHSSLASRAGRRQSVCYMVESIVTGAVLFVSVEEDN